MPQHKEVRGRFVKSGKIKCPDCEKGILQIREIEGHLYNICNVCQYEEENKQENEKKIDAMREMKNYEKNKIYRNKKSTNSRSREDIKASIR